MITLIDGPAARENLMLRRAPLLLRVVFNPKAKKEPWDALDQFDDVPKPHEEIHVYRRVGQPGRLHLKGHRSVSGVYTTGRYVLHPEQPADAVVRDTEAWRKWCIDQCRQAAAAEASATQETVREPCPESNLDPAG